MIQLRPLVLACYGLFVLGVALFLVQLWFTPWTVDFFGKLMMTDAAVFVVVLVLAYFLREEKDSRKTRNSSELE